MERWDPVICPVCGVIRSGVEDGRIIFPCGLMLYQSDEEKVPGTDCRNSHLQARR